MSDMYDSSLDLSNLSSLQVALASPEKIHEWSHGEVTKPETINYKSHKPEKDGLFCEVIFGPKKDNECTCGKYKKGKHKNITCPQCGVEVTTSKVRRIRMGHIDLATPIAHYWYYKGIPSKMSLILEIPQKQLERIISYADYVMMDDCYLEYVDADGIQRTEDLKKRQVISGVKFAEYYRKNGNKKIPAQTGGEAIFRLLQEIDLEEESKKLREAIAKDKLSTNNSDKISTTAEQNIAKNSRRLDTVEMFLKSGTKPEYMMLTALPVIPPDLRPLLQLEGGRFGTSDITEFYRKIIYRNNTLKKQMQCGTPSLIINQQKRMLQTAVDALFENSKRAKPFTGSGNRPLKSLSDYLRGKQGRFRQNLLGKRVDYSGRSVIVVGPELKIYQCGVPKEMALELFKPFVVRKLVSDYKCEGTNNPQAINTEVMAEKLIDKGEDPRVWSSLEKVIKGHPVLLNRAPTLHRLGIQAFEPVLVEGKALKLHPLVCTAFNADFDGDQMAIHIPLSVEAQTEARFLMLSVNNLLAPKDGKPITVPTQDMVLGSYYLTMVEDTDYTNAKLYKNFDEAKLAYDLGIIKLHTPIRVRRTAEFNGAKVQGTIKTTIGRLIFNEAIPQDIGFVDRTKKENALKLEIDVLVNKGILGVIIDKCIKKHGLTDSAVVIDAIKALGYKYSTIGAITVSVADITIPDIKEKMIAEAEQKVAFLREQYEEGNLTEDGRYIAVIDVWNKTTDALTDVLKNNLSKTNPIYMMSDSGARGSMNQIKQLAGMRGLMSDTSGKTIEIPIKANFREGLDVIEFFISSHGTRKTLSDTALRTADSGYLTRRLVYASQDVVIRQRDCGTYAGIEFAEIENKSEKNKPIVPLEDRIRGRYVSDDIVDPTTGEILCDRDTLVTDEIAENIVKAGIKKVKVRSVIECEAPYGVCAKCYGSNLATNNICSIGEAVGIIAAQSIGEPGTQLTMRTFHTGGISSAEDITQGLPRVEELFEARKPKGVAIISEASGKFTINGKGKGNNDIVTATVWTEDGSLPWEFKVVQSNLLVSDGQYVEKGQALTKGNKDPHDVMRILGIEAVEQYIIEEVQIVYNSQGVKINDRHLEVIVRQMLRKVKITDSGDTSLIAGTLVENTKFLDANKQCEISGKEPSKGERQLLGITKAVINSESFLSACSFQETTKVLTDAAIRGKRDELLGLKENILLGKLIPAGTGIDRYKNLEVSGPKSPCIAAIEAAKAKYAEEHVSDAPVSKKSSRYEELEDGAGLEYGEEFEDEVQLGATDDANYDSDDYDSDDYLGDDPELFGDEPEQSEENDNY